MQNVVIMALLSIKDTTLDLFKDKGLKYVITLRKFSRLNALSVDYSIFFFAVKRLTVRFHSHLHPSGQV